MNLMIRVVTQSHKNSNNQMVQRTLIHQEVQIPDGETVDKAYLSVGWITDGGTIIELIQK